MILFLFQNPLTAKYAKPPSGKRRKGRKENELTPGGCIKSTSSFYNVHFFLFVQKETNQRKRAPEMITSAFFGKMP